MENIVKVTRNGQITIPKKLREKFSIKKGDKLSVELTEKCRLFRKIRRFKDMAGIDAEYGTPEEINKEIDKLREEH